jgi:hypothetical protein
MRNLMAVLVAMLIATGTAHATWYWSPLSTVLPLGDSARTADNNARCIVGSGGIIHVVYNRNFKIGDQSYIKVFYSRSSDIGFTWSGPVQLSNSQGAYDSKSPSIGRWDDDNLLVIWSDGDVDHPQTGISVKSCYSTDGGLSWSAQAEVNTDDNYACSSPALSCEVSASSPEWTASAVWRESSLVSSGQRIAQRSGEFDDGFSWAGDDENVVPNAVTRKMGCPAVWAQDHYIHTAEVEFDAPGGIYSSDTLFYDSNEFPGENWPSMSMIDGDDDDRRCGHPSIMCNGYGEVVVYERGLQQAPRNKQVYVAGRLWNGGNPGPFQLVTNPIAPFWADSCAFPQLFPFYSAGVETLLMSATGYVSGEAGAKRAFVVESQTGLFFWNELNTSTFPVATDSCSLWGGECAGSAVPEGRAHRVWVAATYHARQATANSTVLVRTATEAPLTTQADNCGQGARQVVRQPDTDYLHRIRAMANFISYERSTDNGETWDFQDAPDFGSNPTLALYNGNPYISYLRNDSTFCAVLNADSEWTIKTLYAALSGQHLGPPSLAVFPDGSGRLGNVVFPCYDSATASSMILYCQFDTAGGAYSLMLDTLDYSSGKYNDSAACIAVGLSDSVSVCYSSGDSVFARTLFYPPTDNSRPNPWCSASLVGSGGDVSTYHPSCERIGNRLWVAYSERVIDAVTGDTSWAIMRTSCEAADTGIAITWEGTTAVSSTDGYVKDFPSLATAKTVAWAESSGTHWTIKASVDDSILSLTPDDTNCKFVSICADTAVQSTPSTSSTGIYYTWLQQYSGDGDTWAVHYATKSVLTSDADANVTMYNQGRKIVLDHDTTFVVYTTDAGSVRIAKKKDGVEGWTSSLLSNSGDVPALDVDYASRIYACERLFDNSGGAGTDDVIRCQTRAAGSEEWTNFLVYSSAASTQHKLSPPAIAACLSDPSEEYLSAAYIVFAVYEPGANDTTTICMAKVNTTGVVYIDTLRHVSGHGDSFPDIALHPESGEQDEGYVIHVTWQQGTEVYVKKTKDPDQPQYTSKCSWYSGYNLSNTAANSRHAKLAASADTVLVAWVEGDSGVIYVKGQGPGSDYDAWDSPVNVSACPDTVCDQPSVTIAESTIVTYHKKLSATNYDIIARVNFNSNLNISNTATKVSKYPHCVFHFHNDSFPVISTVWTEELSTNYAEVGYKRWQLGEANGGGIQNAGFIDPNIRPCLFAPSPNPFNGQTSIRYATNIKGMTRVSIMDITGRRVRNLLTMPQNPGIYNLTWNARDDRARQLPRGVYFVRLETANYNEARKVVIQ